MKEIANIRDIHHVLFDLLCYFDDVCRTHGIRYFLSNGSLLGAAKYGDFIPWDDDVDLLLPRQDYDSLMHLTQISSGNTRENTLMSQG